MHFHFRKTVECKQIQSFQTDISTTTVISISYSYFLKRFLVQGCTIRLDRTFYLKDIFNCNQKPVLIKFSNTYIACDTNYICV